jgi:hypothetical protein
MRFFCFWFWFILLPFNTGDRLRRFPSSFVVAAMLGSGLVSYKALQIDLRNVYPPQIIRQLEKAIIVNPVPLF